MMILRIDSGQLMMRLNVCGSVNLVQVAARQFYLGNWLFDNDRNAFYILTQLLVRFFHPRLECMTTAHLVNTLNTNFVRPSICFVHLFCWNTFFGLYTRDEKKNGFFKNAYFTCMRAQSISMSAIISPNNGRMSFFTCKQTRQILSNSSVLICVPVSMSSRFSWWPLSHLFV